MEQADDQVGQRLAPQARIEGRRGRIVRDRQAEQIAQQGQAHEPRRLDLLQPRPQMLDLAFDRLAAQGRQAQEVGQRLAQHGVRLLAGALAHAVEHGEAVRGRPVRGGCRQVALARTGLAFDAHDLSAALRRPLDGSGRAPPVSSSRPTGAAW